MRKIFFGVLMLTSVATSASSTELTVWVRAGGAAVKSEITPFIKKILEALPQNMTTKVLVCTNEEDIILEELNKISQTDKKVKVIFSKLSSYSTALTALAQNTENESNVLSISVGVNIRQDQIQSGMQNLVGRVKVYAWSVEGHENDGSCPGKGWYNTAALLDKTVVQHMREGVPPWVDNGVLGKEGKHILGGNEEIPIMVKTIQKDPEATFILNKSDPVTSNLQLGTGISFQEKIERKVVVAERYMKKLHKELDAKIDFEAWRKQIWSSISVI